MATTELDAKLLEVLACPEDKDSLLYFADEAVLYNPRLQRKYKVENGIPVLLIEEAEDANAAEHKRLMAEQ